jgi:hypothetical protein
MTQSFTESDVPGAAPSSQLNKNAIILGRAHTFDEYEPVATSHVPETQPYFHRSLSEFKPSTKAGLNAERVLLTSQKP